MALFTCPDCESKVSTQAEKCPHCGRPVTEEDRKPEPESPKAFSWKWIVVFVLVLAVAAIAVWRMHKGYFPRWVDKQELFTETEIQAKAFCYRKLPLPANKRWGNTEPELKWTHWSSDHCEVWVVLDGPVTMERAEALANTLNGYILRLLKYQFKISELQLADEKCLVSVFVVTKDFSSGEKYLYGGTITSFASGRESSSWLNPSEVRSLFSNSLPVEF